MASTNGGFTEPWLSTDGSSNPYGYITPHANGGPSNRAWLGIGLIATSDLAQPYVAVKKTGLTAPSQGSRRVMRYYWKMASPYNPSGTVEGWTDKFIIVGDQDGEGGDRLIVQLGGHNTDLDIGFTRNIGGMPSEGAGWAAVDSIGDWYAIQLVVDYSTTSGASNGRIKIYINNDTEGSPTAQSSLLALPSASHQSILLGGYHNSAMASGGHIDMGVSAFTYADDFDPSWAADL